MSQSKLALEIFLKEESSTSSNLLAIIEQDEQNKNNVIISSWNKDSRICSISFSIAKNQIESVEKTKDTYNSFGKMHTIVKVNFKKNVHLTLDDIFKQIRQGSFRVLQDRRTGPFGHAYGNGVA